MISNVCSFYILSLILVISSLGVVLSPKMYLALISMLFCVITASILFFNLNAIFVGWLSIFLCLFLLVFVFIFSKKIDKLFLKNKLVFSFKIFIRCILLLLFCFLIFYFVYEEQSQTVFDVFKIVTGVSVDVIDFSTQIFTLHLIVVLAIVCCLVARLFFTSNQGNVFDIESKDAEEEELR